MKKTATALALIILGVTSVFAREITVSVEAGENWKSKYTPQFAVWLEDTEGNYIRTLYVTECASKKNWIFAPKAGRPQSLPVWYHASKQDPRKGKEAKKANEHLGLDAVTNATPKGSMTFRQEIEDADCVIKAEFNGSFDFNEFYTKKNSNCNGQPSVVYEAKIKKGENEETTLAFAGTGSIDGSDGEIRRESKGLTTATSIAKSITVTFPEK